MVANAVADSRRWNQSRFGTYLKSTKQQIRQQINWKIYTIFLPCTSRTLLDRLTHTKQINCSPISVDSTDRISGECCRIKCATQGGMNLWTWCEMQPNLFPFGSVLGNPSAFDGDLSEGFETSRFLFFVPFFLLQGGGMDLSKVGEKILSSVRSARSLGLLHTTSDRPEVTDGTIGVVLDDFS